MRARKRRAIIEASEDYQYMKYGEEYIRRMYDPEDVDKIVKRNQKVEKS